MSSPGCPFERWRSAKCSNLSEVSLFELFVAVSRGCLTGFAAAETAHEQAAEEQEGSLDLLSPSGMRRSWGMRQTAIPPPTRIEHTYCYRQANLTRRGTCDDRAGVRHERQRHGRH